MHVLTFYLTVQSGIPLASLPATRSLLKTSLLPYTPNPLFVLDTPLLPIALPVDFNVTFVYCTLVYVYAGYHMLNNNIFNCNKT